MHDFGLPGVFCKTEVVACIAELVHAVLHFQIIACIKHAVISKEKVPQHSLLALGKGMKSKQVEQFSIHSVLDADSLITVPECISQHNRKHHAEKGLELTHNLV